MSVEVSRHAVKRLKERLGLKKKAVKRYAEAAFKEGVLPKEYGFKPIRDIYNARQELDQSYMYLIYRGLIHIFGINAEKTPVLVTVYDPLASDEREDIFFRGERTKEIKRMK